jgi:SAM-dependent methyltransferase
VADAGGGVLEPTARERLFVASQGERTVPGIWHENYWFRRHEVVYDWVAGLAAGGDVLDAGVGEGYGAAGIATRARRVVGLDYDPTALAHVARTYPGVPVVGGNLVALPFAAAVFDLVVSLQTVEHLWDQPSFVAECARVARTGGWVVLATPNRRTFPPGNWFHTRELDAQELPALLAPALAEVTILGVHHAGALARWEATHGSIVAAQLASPPDAWGVGLADAVRAVRVEDFVLHEHGLDDALDLVAVGRPARVDAHA